MAFKYTYVVTLKNERAWAIGLIGLLITAISAVVFLMELIRHGMNYLVLGGFLVVTGGLIWNIYQGRVLHERVFYNRILMVAGFVWATILPITLSSAGMLLILLGLFEKQAKRSLEIGFTGDHIVVNSLFRDKYNWSDFSSIMLKDGLLTMDFKNNRLYQKQILDDDDDADEDEFNAYCKQQLAPASGS